LARPLLYHLHNSKKPRFLTRKDWQFVTTLTLNLFGVLQMTFSKLTTLSLISASLIALSGSASAKEAFTIFDGYVGFDSLKTLNVEKAIVEVGEVNASRLEAGDMNNICVMHALADEYPKALDACMAAEALVAKDRAVARQTLTDISNNLTIVRSRLETPHFVSAAD
jgi:hypothetical protein